MRWDNALCEPVLITYNRAQHLDKTLAAFFALKDTGMRFHVLDNNSTDETAAIVSKWQSQWPMLVSHRNTYNIGGGANILRALELSNAVYAWILGDDDAWHLQHIDLLMDALVTCQADIIRLGWLVSESFSGTLTSANTLFTAEHYFFASLSMISATVVKRSLITAHLPQAYGAINTFYPQLALYIAAMQTQSLSIYSLKKALLIHTPNHEPGYFNGDLEWYAGWFKAGQFFTDLSQKKHFNQEIVRYMIRPKTGYWAEFLWLLQVALNAKARHLPQWRYLGVLFIFGSGWRFRLSCITLIYALFPTWLAKLARRGYYYLANKPYREALYDRSRL